MLVIKGPPRLLSFVLTIGVVIIFCYFVLLAEIENHQENGRRRRQKNNRKIVAYSLLKQIELESKEYDCGQKIFAEAQKTVTSRQNGTGKLWTNLEGSNLHIYSVYYDRRLYPYHYVRIIAMVKGTWNDPLFCQILSSNGHYHITKATTTKIWSEAWNQNDTNVYYNPFLLSCRIPINISPIRLSLSKHPCKINQQKFKISPNIALERNKNSFTICVKPLNFPTDISDHLLQWTVMNRVLGAEKIEFYIEHLPEKTLHFLEKLEKFLNGSVVLHRHHNIDYFGDFDQITRLWQKRRYELITYNDCLYRNIHASQFIIPVDTDEIIIPRHVSTWAELLQDTLSKGEPNFASYTVRNAYYLRRFNTKRKRLKEKILFFSDVWRSELSDEGESGKSFVVTKNTLTVFNHYALKVLKPGIRRIQYLNGELVQMNHYKDDCSIVILPECAKYLSSPTRIFDNVIFKYKERFYEQYAKLLAFFN